MRKPSSGISGNS